MAPNVCPRRSAGMLCRELRRPDSATPSTVSTIITEPMPVAATAAASAACAVLTMDGVGDGPRRRSVS